MAQRTTFEISIPEPCGEDWNAMQPVRQNRRYCDSCEKQIIDFTRATDGQILRAFRTNAGKLCGRFRPDQLSRPLELPAKPAVWYRRVATWLGILFSGGPLVAQEAPDPTEQVQTLGEPTLEAHQSVSKKIIAHRSEVASFILESTVSEAESGEALPFATVAVMAGKGREVIRGVLTDLDGKFRVAVKAGDRLQVSYTGYETSEVAVKDLVQQSDFVATQDQRGNKIWLAQGETVSLTGGILGDIIIVQRRPNTLFNQLKQLLRRRKALRNERLDERLAKKVERRERRALRQLINEKAEPIAPEPAPKSGGQQLIVYPNPISGPFSIAYNSQAEQTAMIEIYAADGRPVYFKAWELVSGDNTIRLDSQDFGVAPGHYTLLLILAGEEVMTQTMIME